MEAVLAGSSPGATTAAILLMSRARQLGYPLRIDIAGNPAEITPIFGPAVVHAPVLASCGVGRALGHGGTVVIPGAKDTPLLVSLTSGGSGGWFEVHRNGPGIHEGSQAFYRLSHDPRVEARKLAKHARILFEIFGVTPSTGLMDLLFSAPVPALTRIALTLRAGRSVKQGVSQSVTQFLTGGAIGVMEPFPPQYPGPGPTQDLLTQISQGQWLSGLNESARGFIARWADLALTLAREDDVRDGAFAYFMCELISHLEQLPAYSILPPLDSALDGVALCMPKALQAIGQEDANQMLRQMFTFLGGRYVNKSANMFQVHAVEAPEGPKARWKWFCEAAIKGRERADELWPLITDPPS